MQIQKISFTAAEQPQQKRESNLYSKKGYMNLVRTSQFMEGALAVFAALECIDKFQLIKKTDVAKDVLKQTAKKHTKYNIIWGILGGIVSALIGKFVTDKYTLPFAEKSFDYAQKQEEISNSMKKAKAEVEAKYNNKSIPENEIEENKEEKQENKVEKPETENKEEINEETNPPEVPKEKTESKENKENK